MRDQEDGLELRWIVVPTNIGHGWGSGLMQAPMMLSFWSGGRFEKCKPEAESVKLEAAESATATKAVCCPE